MPTVLKRLLKAILHIPGLLQRRLHVFFIVVVLSLVSLVLVSQQSFSGVTVGNLHLKSLQSATRAVVHAAQEQSASPYKRRLFVRLPGEAARLGNRMFAHAALLGLATHTGLQAAVLSHDDKDTLSSVFDLTTPVVADERLVRLRTVKWPWRTAVYVPPPTNLTDGGAADEDILLIGYFQSWRYFQAVDERVRAEFRFRKHIADAAADVLRQLTANYSDSSTSLVLVGIHVRRSDMAHGDHLRRGYTVADEHYIRRAMSFVADRVTTESNATSTSLLFVVCTDDERWARLNVRPTSYPIVFASSPHRTAEVDLAVLASCHHVITTVGTFSWWAGYLRHRDGITVYYAGFPKPGTEIGNDFHPEDFYPPGWIGLL